MNKSHTILTTKLQIPNIPDDYIKRDHLIKYLNNDINRVLTLFSAGAGYGKSTFVSDWVSNIPYKSCWFSIDENDNDIRTFLSYFIASIQTQIPKFGENIYKRIFSPNISSVDILSNNLINDLNNIDNDIILVLDDFQYITNLEIVNIVSNILKYPPKKFHLVIISRVDPSLPLHKLRASNKMKDIRSSNLRLTNDEVKVFIRNNFNIENNEKIISLFNNKFEGWVTGIRLLKIHLSYTNFSVNKLEEFILNSNLSEVYFIEELIKRIDLKTLQFLLQTSVFNKFNSELSNYVLSTKDKTFCSSEIIKDLLSKNLFLINLDNTNNWFRYHHLFKNALQKELRKNYSKQEIISIHKKASSWYIENNFYEEAFYHIIEIDDIDTTVDFVRTYMYMPLNVNKWYVLEKWLKIIPDSAVNKCPVLLTAQMWVMQHKGAYWIIPELINKVENIKDNNIELYENIKHQLGFFKGIINFWNANINESIEQLGYVRNKIAYDKLGAISLSTIYYALALYMHGDGIKIYKEIQSEISKNNLPIDYKIILLATLLYINLLQGNLYEAELLAKQIKKHSSSLDNDFYVAWYEFFMGYISFMQCRKEEALLHFKKSLDLVFLLNTHGPIDAFAGVLIILNKTNKNKEYDKINNELTSFIHEWNNPAYNTIAYSLKSRLSIINKDIKKAIENYKKTDMYYDANTVIFNIEVPRVTYCKLLLAEGTDKKIEEAINKLNELNVFVSENHIVPQIIDVLILLSVAYYKKNKLQKAIEKITEAIILAENGQIIYPFVEQSEIINILLPKIHSDNENVVSFISLLVKNTSNIKKIVQKRNYHIVK